MNERTCDFLIKDTRKETARFFGLTEAAVSASFPASLKAAKTMLFRMTGGVFLRAQRLFTCCNACFVVATKPPSSTCAKCSQSCESAMFFPLKYSLATLLFNPNTAKEIDEYVINHTGWEADGKIYSDACGSNVVRNATDRFNSMGDVQAGTAQRLPEVVLKICLSTDGFRCSKARGLAAKHTSAWVIMCVCLSLPPYLR